MAKSKTKGPTEIMVVNDTPGQECRIAILADNHLEELYSERTDTATNVGNIYKGRVVNVEPAIQAAFVDFGQGQNGFLHISDLHPRYFPNSGNTERVGRKMPHRERPPIQEALKRGTEVIVQVLKEGIGTKGPTLTSYLSIPGRLLVCMPFMDRVGVSRKIEDDDTRREMRKVLDAVDLPEGFGFILRTAGIGQNKTELKRDVAYLMRLWKAIEDRINKTHGPSELYTESDVLIRTVRDVVRSGMKAIVVDSESGYDRICAFLHVAAPRSTCKVIRYKRGVPIFHAFNIERQIDLIHNREVPLPSGGAIIIDQTEALVAVDVNSGRSRSARDSETNAFKTNCEAIDEICRQLRLRDLGGILVLDLIDMRQMSRRREVEARLRENLRKDRAKTTALRISDFGLVELTRQRMRPSMRKAHFVGCPTCSGHGEIKSPESVAADAVRHLGFLIQYEQVARVELVCSPRVASVLLSTRRRELVHLEEAVEKSIDVRISESISVDRVDYYAYDKRSADIDAQHLPALVLPKLEDLEREADEVPESAEDGPPTKRRRRRRKRSGPADATQIALAGGFDIEEEPEGAEESTSDEDKPRRKKRRRRRRGRRDEETAAPGTATSNDAASEQDTTPEDDNPVRVHVLAKSLGVKSKDIITRCQDQDDIDIKTHMSSVTGAQAALIRTWFGDDENQSSNAATTNEEATSAEADQEGGNKKRRRRRGRRGGRGRRRNNSESTADNGDATPVNSSDATDQDNAAAASTPVDESEAAEDEQPRRRSRRGRRRSSRKTTDQEQTSAAENNSKPKPKPAAVEVKTSDNEKSSTGSKKRRTKKKSSGGQRKKTTKAASAKSDAKKPAASGSTDDAATAKTTKKKTTKKRRSIYRHHTKVSSAARATAAELDA